MVSVLRTRALIHIWVISEVICAFLLVYDHSSPFCQSSRTEGVRPVAAVHLSALRVDDDMMRQVLAYVLPRNSILQPGGKDLFLSLSSPAGLQSLLLLSEGQHHL